MFKKIFHRTYQNLREWKNVRSMLHEHNSLITKSENINSSNDLKKLLILPCDPWSLDGSKGDEAMVQGMVENLRCTNNNLKIAIIVATPEARTRANKLGFEAISAWNCKLTEAISLIKDFSPDAMFVLGADVMDGYYSPRTTARLLLLANLVANRGTRVAFTGYSFNANPSPLLKKVFASISSAVSLNARDPISLERFKVFSTATIDLVADAAFLLTPDTTTPKVREIADWADQRRAAGDIVLGFNLHPTLIRNPTEQDARNLIQSAITAIASVSKTQAVSFLLISHDYRVRDNDDKCLKPISDNLSAELGVRLLYPTDRFSAAELKAIAGATDGVVSGRMHLAIATLGMQKPIAAITYQDKFQGLLQHFYYPKDFLLPASEALEAKNLQKLIENFLNQIKPLTQIVINNLPAVKILAQKNVDKLLGN